MRSFRPLLIFWAALLVLLGAGVGMLAYLGPLPPAALQQRGGAQISAAARGTRTAAGQDNAAKPGPSVPERAAPAYASGGTGASSANPSATAPKPRDDVVPAIPDPVASLQEPAVNLPGRLLPRVDDSGRTPAQVYAAPFDAKEKHPRVALVVDGIGLDQAMSEQALKTLPRTVDIAFSAYAPAAVAEALARQARRQGRECLVSIPMEPAGFPAAEEGNKALLTGNSPDQNRLNLEWALSSLQGCAGATSASDGMLGERYAESRQSFTDLLSVLDHRGMIYLDARPGVAPLDDTAGIHTPPRIADIVIDKALSVEAPAAADAIDANLAELAKLAALHGSAIGVAGPPRPVLLERIAVWANTLAAKNLVLAPLTAMPLPKQVAGDPPP